MTRPPKDFNEYAKKILDRLEELVRRPVRVEAPPIFRETVEKFDAYLTGSTIDARLADLSARLLEQHRQAGDRFAADANVFRQAVLSQMGDLKQTVAEQQASLASETVKIYRHMQAVLEAEENSVMAVPAKHRDYISDKPEVVSGTPYVRDVLEGLNRLGRYGSVVSDDGTVVLTINGGNDVTLDQNDVFNIRVEENMEVEELRVRTTSAAALTVRVFIA